ncbi:hypothetical protein BH23CHL8_BH23CHL8_28790 [soil metagenome]
MLPAGTYLLASGLTIGDNCSLTGQSRMNTVLRLADGANVTVLRNLDPVSGNVNISIENVIIDGNRTAQDGTSEKRGIELIRCAGIALRSVVVRNTDGKGVYLNAEATETGAYIGPAHIDDLWSHHNRLVGFQISNGLRRSFIRNLLVESNEGYGAILDSSETSCAGVVARFNLGAGIFLRNIQGCSINSLVSTMNGEHGILVRGLRSSVGVGWLAQSNGRLALGGWDDLYFGENDDPTGGYGRTADLVLSGVVAGPNEALAAQLLEDPRAYERAGVWFEDDAVEGAAISAMRVVPGSQQDVRWPVDTSRLLVSMSSSSGLSLEQAQGILDAPDGISTLVKEGPVTDSDFANPADGMLAVDSGNQRLYVRIGGGWRSVPLE